MQQPFLLKWYEKALTWSRHPKAAWYLGILSFIDASLFPVSPIVMILPMSFAAPKRAFYFASIAIVGSFLGGMVGYCIGFFAYELMVEPFIQWMGYTAYYQIAMQWFNKWGCWAIFIGCFMPLAPYKIFTIGAGALQLDFFSFLLSSILGRSGRFFLIAVIIRLGGPKVEPVLRRMLAREEVSSE